MRTFWRRTVSTPASGSDSRVVFWTSRLQNSLIALFLPGSVFAAGLEAIPLDPDGVVSVPLGAGLAARVAYENEVVRVSVDGVQEAMEAVFVSDTPPLLTADVNGDRLRDLFVPTGEGYGGVNLFYSLLLSGSSGSWSRIDEISNPALSGAGDLTSSRRSGPFWTETRWSTAPDNTLYRRVSQTMTSRNVVHRQLFRPNGTLERQMLIDPQASITHGATQLTLISERPLDIWSDTVAEAPGGQTERGMRLRLLALDELSGRVLVRLADGTRGWIAASDAGLGE